MTAQIELQQFFTAYDLDNMASVGIERIALCQYLDARQTDTGREIRYRRFFDGGTYSDGWQAESFLASRVGFIVADEVAHEVIDRLAADRVQAVA